ncbi:MAG: hypothetical protein KJ626_03170 [Verrucomicrobia bacterium]|nr:hypothetical protein [Verrucomicrobiota bacterium]
MPTLKPGTGSISDSLSTCPKCGSAIPRESSFCTSCGYNLQTGKFVQEGRGLGVRFLVKVILLGIILAGLSVGSIYVYVIGRRNISETPRKNEHVDASLAVDSANTEEWERVPLDETSFGGETSAAISVMNEEPRYSSTDDTLSRDIEREESDRVVADVAERWPPFSVGDATEIRMQNGKVLIGAIHSLTTSNVVISLSVSGVRKEVPFPALDFGNRMRADPDFRELWIDTLLSSRLWNLERSEADGEDTEEMNVVNASDVFSQESLPQRLTEIGLEVLKGTERAKDASEAFIYFFAAAQCQHPEALYYCGRMLVAGRGVERDERSGLRFLALSASAGFQDAEEFLRKKRYSEEKLSVALAEEKDRIQREREAHSQRLLEMDRAERVASTENRRLRGVIRKGRPIEQKVRSQGGTILVDGNGRKYYWKNGKKRYIID